MSKPNEMSAVEAAQAIAAGALTSEQLVTACLEQIRASEKDIQAWVHIDEAGALAAARAADNPANGAGEGPLRGLPVGLKDIIDTANMPTGYGSAIYPTHQPLVDAACVSLIREAGGINLGKTVTTEFAFVNPGKTRNPHNLSHTPGGSSSGSAAAVAAHMVPLAFGTQTGGSIIRPASFCGVVGYKPTFGQFSYSGVKLLSGSLDTLGGFARNVEDLVLLRSAMCGTPSTMETGVFAAYDWPLPYAVVG